VARTRTSNSTSQIAARQTLGRVTLQSDYGRKDFQITSRRMAITIETFTVVVRLPHLVLAHHGPRASAIVQLFYAPLAARRVIRMAAQR
jgi:hypothetical protein